MADDAEELEFEIQQELNETQEQFRQRLIKIGAEAAEGVIEKTPVDTGFLVNSWQAGIGEINIPIASSPPGNQTVSEADASRSKKEATENAESVISLAELGDVITIANGANYAAAVENGVTDEEGNRIRDGVFMVRTTIAELRTRFGRD